MSLTHRLDAFFGTEQHQTLREQIARFAEHEIRPRISAMETEQSVHYELSVMIAEQGWLGVTIDPAYGGMGCGHLAKTVLIEEISRVSAAMGAMVQASQLGAAKILHYGTASQKQRWLPGIAAGTVLPTIAVTERGSGGHVLGMTTTAERDGDDYILNGHKTYVGNSHIGTLHGVVARTGPGTLLTAFLVEHDRPGLSLGEPRSTLGLHGFSFGELLFENCRVPADNRIGAEGDGLAVAYSSSVVYGRPNITAVALGIHRALVDDTINYLAHQPRYDGRLADLPTIHDKIGRIRSNLLTAGITAYHAASLLDHEQACDDELMNAKLIGVDLLLDSARTAIDAHGAAGLLCEHTIERYLRDAHHLLAPAGTPDIQRRRLAETVLDSSKPPWTQQLATGNPP